MIIKFVKLQEFAGYFVFFFGVDKVYCTSMPDDDFIIKNGWKRESYCKVHHEIEADSNKPEYNLC